jgi:hypothetical protein
VYAGDYAHGACLGLASADRFGREDDGRAIVLFITVSLWRSDRALAGPLISMIQGSSPATARSLTMAADRHAGAGGDGH